MARKRFPNVLCRTHAAESNEKGHQKTAMVRAPVPRLNIRLDGTLSYGACRPSAFLYVKNGYSKGRLKDVQM